MPEYTPEFEENDAGSGAAEGAAGCFQQEYITNPKPAVTTTARETNAQQQSTEKPAPAVSEALGQQADNAKLAAATTSDKTSVKGEAKTTVTLDGMTRTVQEMKDGSVVIKTHPPYYPKDGYQIEHRKGRDFSKGSSSPGAFKEIRISDSENIGKNSTLTEQEKIEKDLHFRGSRDSDKNPRGEVRNLTRAEVETLKRSCPNFQLIHKEGLISISLMGGMSLATLETVIITLGKMR